MKISPRLTLLAVLSALTLALPACAPTPAPAPRSPALEAPRPPGMQDPAVIPSDPAAPPGSCDPRASLRPPATLPAPGSMPGGSTMAAIVKRGRLIVGVDQNTYRFGYRDSGSGELAGFDIDVARQVARALFGTDAGHIQFRALNSGVRIDAIKANSVDIVVETMTMNCARLQEVAFSTEYFTAGQRILVTRGSTVRSINDLGQQKVCAAAGSTSIRNIAAAASKPVPVSVVNWTDCLVLLQQNQVAAVSTDNSILAGLSAQDPNTQVVGPAFSDEPYGIAMAKDATDLVRFVNGVLARMRADGTWTRLYHTWLGELGPAPQPPVARYRD
jgi:polar amino acid transport system substrate-binding protein